jgi:hypothetical protein
MARQNGQATFQTPGSNAIAVTANALGDDTSSTSTRRVFLATERMTVVEVGAVATDSANVPGAGFTYRVKKRTGGASANDIVIDVFASAFAAEGGPGGDPSTAGFNLANAIANGIITNTAAKLKAGTCLRAFCEVSLDKGDQLVFEVVASGGASSVAAFYATVWFNSKSLVEQNDVESN